MDGQSGGDITSLYAITPTCFRIYLYFTSITPAQANTWGWHINWMAAKGKFYPYLLQTKYYYFNGQRIAMKQNGHLTYLHNDHLGSTVLATDDQGDILTNRGYRAYGNYRSGGTLPTDHQFTGQKQDRGPLGRGLIYMNARYYDPMIGCFVSP